MKPQLIVVDSVQGIKDLEEYLLDKDYVAFDCETNGVHKGATVIGFSVCAEDSKAFYVLLEGWNEELLTVLTIDEVLPLLNLIKTKSLLMHNAVFDCRVVEDYFKVSLIQSLHTDTMILAHLLNENRRVGLKELSKEYFGLDSANEQAEMKASVLANGGKLTKDTYEMYKCDPYILGTYGAKDALLTYKLFMELVPDLFEQGLDKFFYEEESMPLLKGPTYQLNTVGLKVDQQGLISLRKQLEAECAEAKDFIYSEINEKIKTLYPGTNKKNTFNLGSNQQLSWLLFGIYTLEFGTLTDAGKDACAALNLRLPYNLAAKRDFIRTCQLAFDKKMPMAPESIINGKKVKAKYFKQPWAYIGVDKKVLAKLAPKYKWIERLLEYQRKTKIINTYITGIEERIQYGVIRPSFLQHGTTSGRYASRDPNFQNLPRDDKRIKECIVARPGKTFVGADYSQLEPRVFAYFSNDKRLLAALNGEDDFYSVIGMEVYGKYDCIPRKDGSPEAFGIKYKRLRDLSKVIALASTYGATPSQLSSTTGKSREDTAADIDAYFESFPGVLRYMRDSHEHAKSRGSVTSLFGRPRRMPEALKIDKVYGKKPHSEYPYEVRNILNLAVNHRIQSTGASIVNRAAIKFYNDINELGINCQLVLQVHDSLIAECDIKDQETVSIILQNAMETAVDLKTVRLEAEPKCGNNLGKV